MFKIYVRKLIVFYVDFYNSKFEELLFIDGPFHYTSRID